MTVRSAGRLRGVRGRLRELGEEGMTTAEYAVGTMAAVAFAALLLAIVRSGDADVAVGSRFVSGDGYEAYRYEPSPSRRFGTAVLRRGMKAALGSPFHDATSGMYAVNARAMPILAEPYESGAQEVESLLRLQQGGLKVVEVPVDMRERASGGSKLQGKRAVQLVLTVAGTLLAYGLVRRVRGSSR